MATIRKRGTRYQVQVRRLGQSVAKSFVNLSDAKQWARTMEVAADRRELPNPKALQGVTLRELIERYRDKVLPRKRGACGFETIILNAFLRDYPKLANKALSAVTLKDFAGYRDERLKSVSSATVKRQLTPLRHMFKVARTEWGLKVGNPIEGLGLSDGAPRERRLREGELDRLLQVAKPEMARVILFALETSMRRGEILAIQPEDINWQEPSLRIPRSKNGHSRTIPLSSKAVEILREGVFPMTVHSLRQAWPKLCEKAGIEGLTLHDLRHEGISRLFELGLSVVEVASVSGHRDFRMLARYSHAQRKTILEKLG